MKLEDAIELVLKVAKRHAETYDQEEEILEASNIVEDFFVNNVFEWCPKEHLDGEKNTWQITLYRV